jgi:hypothetical protein
VPLSPIDEKVFVDKLHELVTTASDAGASKMDVAKLLLKAIPDLVPWNHVVPTLTWVYEQYKQRRAQKVAPTQDTRLPNDEDDGA